MFRTAVTIYLSLATLVGPAVCCCSVPPLAAPVSATQPVRPSSSDDSGGCPHCRKHPAPATPDTPANGPDRPCKPECPCRSHAAQPALIQTDSDLGGVLSTPLSAVALFPHPHQAGVDNGGRADAPVTGVPFLTAQDLLRAHHLLRC